MQVMFRLTIFAAALLVAGLSGGASPSAAETEQVFKFYCAQCHGLGGKGEGLAASWANSWSMAIVTPCSHDGAPIIDSSPYLVEGQ